MHSLKSSRQKLQVLEAGSAATNTSDVIGIFLIATNSLDSGLIDRSIDRLSGYKLIGRKVDRQEALESISSLRPDLVIIESPNASILDATITKEIKVNFPRTNILIVSSESNPQSVRHFLSAGANGFCRKDSQCQHLALAIQAVSLGAVWLDPELAAPLLKAPIRSTTTSAHNQLLSDREMSVLKLIAEGLTNQAIGERLWLSRETVKSHIKNIMRKLVVSDRTQAVMAALRLGIEV